MSPGTDIPSLRAPLLLAGALVACAPGRRPEPARPRRAGALVRHGSDRQAVRSVPRPGIARPRPAGRDARGPEPGLETRTAADLSTASPGSPSPRSTGRAVPHAAANRRRAAKRSDWTSDRVWETYKEPYELFQATDTSWDPSGQDFNDLGARRRLRRPWTGQEDPAARRQVPGWRTLVSEDAQAFLPGVAADRPERQCRLVRDS